MKKSLRERFAAVLAVLVLALAMATPAYAVRKATIKNATYTYKRATATKRATKVIRGTYRLTITSGIGYAKFTAPSSKTYTFSVSNVKDSNYGSCGYWYVMTSHDYKGSKYIGQTKVATHGGKSATMWMTVNGRPNSGSGVSEFRASRNAKIRLKKGETVFVYFRFPNKGTAATLKIS